MCFAKVAGEPISSRFKRVMRSPNWTMRCFITSQQLHHCVGLNLCIDLPVSSHKTALFLGLYMYPLRYRLRKNTHIECFTNVVKSVARFGYKTFSVLGATLLVAALSLTDTRTLVGHTWCFH